MAHSILSRSARAAILAVFAFLPAAGWAQSCGVERWSVKTGTDPDAGLVDLASPQSNTIATLRSWPAPNPIPANNRVSPYETTVWVINATLTEFKLENDSDIHLVLQDASGLTMIAEIPAPACVGASSPFASGIANARSEFTAVYTPTTSFQTVSVPVKVTGVGMFDFLHGQTGVAPNGIELHPVIDIQFNPSASNTVTASITNPSGNVTVTSGTAVSFAGTATDSSASATLSYGWAFGDGATSAEARVVRPGRVAALESGVGEELGARRGCRIDGHRTRRAASRPGVVRRREGHRARDGGGPGVAEGVGSTGAGGGPAIPEGPAIGQGCG